MNAIAKKLNNYIESAKQTLLGNCILYLKFNIAEDRSPNTIFILEDSCEGENQTNVSESTFQACHVQGEDGNNIGA